MKFVKLKFSNLFSYGNYENEIYLDKPGITFVKGFNKNDSSSNGSGKCVDYHSKINIRVHRSIWDKLNKEFIQYKRHGLWYKYASTTVGNIVDLFIIYPNLKGNIEVETKNGWRAILEAQETAFEAPVKVFSNGIQIICSPNHRLSINGEWTFAKDCHGKEIDTAKGKELVSVVQLDYSTPLYDLQVEGEEYIVEGVRSHNSSLIDIFVWNLYGKPLKDMPADDVKNHTTGEPGFASIQLWKDEDFYEIERYRGHKEYGNGVLVKKNGTIDDTFMDGTNRDIQKQLDSFLGLDYTSFVSSVIFSSEIPFKFPKLTADRRRAHLETILGLQEYSEYGKLAKQRTKAIRNELEDMSIEQREKKIFLESERDNLSSLISKSKNFSEDKQIKLEKIKLELDSIDNQIKDIDLQIGKEAVTYKEWLLPKIEEEKQRVRQDEIEIVEFKAAEKLYKTQLSTIEKEFTKDKENLTKAAKLIIADHKKKIDLMSHECPTCNRGWENTNTDSHIQEHTKAIQETENNLIQSIQLLQETVNKNISELTLPNIDLKQLEERYSLHKTLVENKLKELAKTEETIRNSPNEKTVESLIEKKNRLLSDLESKKAESNPYLDIIDTLKIKVTDLMDQLDRLDEKKNNLDDRLKYLSFWDESFNNDGLKLFVFESIIPLLNQRIKHYLPLLFEGKSVLLHFDKLMNMFILKEGKAISYGSASKGERQRIDLAIAIALLETAQAQHGNISNVLFFDELIDSSLDTKAVNTVMDILYSMPVESIYLISHRTEISERFDNILEIEKQGEFSRILT